MEGVAITQEVCSRKRGYAWLSVAALSLSLVAIQSVCTLRLFGPLDAWAKLLDDQPILSGRHPLHFYHAWLTSSTLWDRSAYTCYDPRFQAGYPRTPVFDSGCRPAELFMLAGRGESQPRLYKVGVFLTSISFPIALILAGSLAGLCAYSRFVMTALAMVLYWGTAGRSLIEQGDLDLLIAIEAAMIGIGCLLRWDRNPSGMAWLGLFLSGLVGWFAQPYLILALLPAVLVYYLSVGNRHGISWHAGLVVSLGLPVVLHMHWLRSMFLHWWIRSPLGLDAPLLPERTLQSFFYASIWGDSLDRILAATVLVLAVLGIVLLNGLRERAAARFHGICAGGFLILALVGIAWEPLARLGTHKLIFPAIWFAVLPAGYAFTSLLRLAARSLRKPIWQVAGVLGVCIALTGLFPQVRLHLKTRLPETSAMQVGYSNVQRQLMDVLREHTTRSARILLEDTSSPHPSTYANCLIARDADRIVIGAMDPEACLEHTLAGLRNGALAGRPIGLWSDHALRDYCYRYNVGWVLCFSPETNSRLASWTSAEAVQLGLGSDQGGTLYRVRQPHSFILRGQASIDRMDHRLVSLVNLVPENGEVVLSMHYQRGLRVWPSRVQLSREPNPYGGIPLIRLRLQEPVTRVVLAWEEP